MLILSNSKLSALGSNSFPTLHQTELPESGGLGNFNILFCSVSLLHEHADIYFSLTAVLQSVFILKLSFPYHFPNLCYVQNYEREALCMASDFEMACPTLR